MCSKPSSFEMSSALPRFKMKRLAREGADLGIDQQMRLERDAAVRALPSDDVAEGLDAFENRRAPEFKA